MTAWTAFASVAGVVTVLLLLASHTTSQRFGDSDDVEAGTGYERVGVEAGTGEEPVDSETVETTGVDAVDSETVETTGVDAVDSETVETTEVDPDAVAAVAPREFGADVEVEDAVAVPGVRERVLARSGEPALSQPMLLLNVAFSQGVFAVVLVAAAVLAEVPRGALGVGDADLSGGLLVVGVALGVALYAVNEAGSSLADAAGFGRSEELRELLAPTSRAGWVVLLGGVLPIVAAFEELLFRGVLVGALSTGFGVSPWLLAVASSVLFGLGHGAQGRLGVLVTGALGVVLAAAFVLSGSLLVVVVAHYLVNALEFVVHEGVLAGE
ncbi:CPBP family intramembrane glutamic endopeptidase [Halorubellus litoreus]|uniref:CPBP family intramembrane glutamic endopeptidase n=1 Tax=Halorubellus litoreus TaxID=755308 RepID=A0ABD5V965_9EURY